MTPEEKQLLIETSTILKQFLDIYYRTNLIDKVFFDNPIYIRNGLYFKDGTILSTGSTTGLKIGNSSTEKIGFYGATPIVRQGSIAAPSGGATQDTQARTAINSLITVLQNLGLTA